MAKVEYVDKGPPNLRVADTCIGIHARVVYLHLSYCGAYEVLNYVITATGLHKPTCYAPPGRWQRAKSMISRVAILLDKIRTCPAMYLGVNSVTRLLIFLEGYECGISELDKNSVERRALRIIQTRIEEHYNFSVDRSWANILRFVSADEAAALDLFWVHWDEIRREFSDNQVGETL